MRPTGILIFVPAYGQSMTAHTAQSLYKLASWLTIQKINHNLTWYSGADIEEVRNLAITRWYDGHPEYSHILFVDSDMGFEPELIRDYIRFDKPLIGCLYAKRSQNVEIVGMAPEGHSLKDVVHGFIRSDGIGGGVMMISREVIKTMIEKWPFLADPIPSVLAAATPDMKLTRIIRCFDKIRGDDLRLSEDMSFCYRWLACGGEIWANVKHRISHVGPFDYAIRYGAFLEAKAEEEAKKQAEAA